MLTSEETSEGRGHRGRRVLGRGLASRLLSQGHEVVGISRRRPDSWPSQADFVAGDIRDAAAVRRAITGADVVAHCAWARNPGPDGRISQQINIDGTRNVLDAMAACGTGRIVFTSSPRLPAGSADAGHRTRCGGASFGRGRHKADVEQMLQESGAQWVAVRSALIVGRNIDNWVRRLFALPAFPDGSADDVLQVVHLDDVLRLLTRAVSDVGAGTGPVNLAAPGCPRCARSPRHCDAPSCRSARRFAALGRSPNSNWCMPFP